MTSLWHRLLSFINNTSWSRLIPFYNPKPMANPFPTTEDTSHEQLSKGLSELVENSAQDSDVTQSIHAPTHKIASHPWLHKFIPGLQHWEASHHIGNYVIVRDTHEKIFESMPIYARIGMHLLFYGKEEIKFLQNKTVEEHLQDQSIKEGKIFDAPGSISSIPSFIEQYQVNLNELEKPDIKSYGCFNEFFYRKLKPGMRPVQNAENPKGLCSAADCRLMVFDSIEQAKNLWIKGNNFSLPNLLGSEQLASQFAGGTIAVFRLAPADYHRFHSPADVILGEATHYPGQYYTVNPQAVNEPGFDVFTANTRSVLMLKHASTGLPIAFVAIGALLVGSIKFTSEEGASVKRGEELGYFAYGGSTCIAVFPKEMGLVFDADLRENSASGLETLVKVGYSLGVAA